jgi:hypothetical protein
VRRTWRPFRLIRRQGLTEWRHWEFWNFEGGHCQFLNFGGQIRKVSIHWGGKLYLTITPPLKTVRYFPLSGGPENCYNIKNVPKGHYSVRVFFGLVSQPNFDNEPLFDVSVEGTQICSLQSGWSRQDDQTFAEALVFLLDHTASICFHSTGHGDPTILAIEILQVDDMAYYSGPMWSQGTILRTTKRLSCGTGKSKFDADNSGDHWGGDRFWKAIPTFGQNSDTPRSTESSIKQASISPNRGVR